MKAPGGGGRPRLQLQSGHRSPPLTWILMERESHALSLALSLRLFPISASSITVLEGSGGHPVFPSYVQQVCAFMHPRVTVECFGKNQGLVLDWSPPGNAVMNPVLVMDLSRGQEEGDGITLSLSSLRGREGCGHVCGLHGRFHSVTMSRGGGGLVQHGTWFCAMCLLPRRAWAQLQAAGRGQEVSPLKNVYTIPAFSIPGLAAQASCSLSNHCKGWQTSTGLIKPE